MRLQNTGMCVPSTLPIKVVSKDRRLAIYSRTPITASQVLSENPGQFLCEPGHLKVGQRIPGMCGEEELEKGRVYVLLPMEMLYSVLTSEEMNSLAPVLRLKQAGMLSFSRICLFPNVQGGTDSGNVEKLSKQRSWEPALETISETLPHEHHC